MTSNSTPSSLRAEQPRQGKWTKDEEAYVDLLIEEFRCGALPLREGTTLRSFLSKMINCNPKRVSKKYENTNYNGKHKYEPSTIPMSLEEMKRRRERLQEYERRFLQALKRSEDEFNMNDEDLRASLEESRSVAASQETAERIEKEDTAMANKMTSSVMPNGFQDRLTAELQSRMDLANQISGAGGGSGSTGEIRDMSLTNAANMTLALPPGFLSPGAGNTSASLNQLSSFDIMSSLKQTHPSYSTSTTIGGLSGQPAVLEDDPLGWQVRIQRRAAMANQAQRMAMDRMSLAPGADKLEPSPLQFSQYSRRSNHQEETLKRLTAAEASCPTLSSPESRRLLHPGAMDHLSQFQLASLVAREERRSLVANAGGLEAATTGPRRSSFMSEREMMESLKRGRERQEAMDTLRPFKRIR